MGRFEPPDFSQGDANTLGGYRAAHGRPPAFEGSDGVPYSVEIVADGPEIPGQQYGAYLLFVGWRSSDPVAVGHLETGYLAFGPSEADALAALSAMSLQTAREHLERALLQRSGADPRKHNGQKE